MSLTSSENDVATEDELNDVSMDVGEKSLAAGASFDEVEEIESLQGLKGPEVNYICFPHPIPEADYCWFD